MVAQRCLPLQIGGVDENKPSAFAFFCDLLSQFAFRKNIDDGLVDNQYFEDSGRYKNVRKRFLFVS